jgi:hypothetical protein
MSWKKHFSIYSGSPISGNENKNKTPADANHNTRFQSWLPELYSGVANRTDRYQQYDQMDADSEVNTALDTIAEFSTQFDATTNMPFKLTFKNDATESEIEILEEALRQWCDINDWDQRIFKTFRNTIKYGDQPFIRDPDTWKLYYVSPVNVLKVVLNEAQGRKPEQYIVKELELNVANKTATAIRTHNTQYVGSKPTSSPTGNNGAVPGATTTPQSTGINETAVNSEHVMHLALTEGMDAMWPFGTSILDSVFKTYKQKELLEDSLIIYRVQRAPERRVFQIDTGNLPPHKATAFVERIKNEIHQRRIPNKNGGSQNVMDAQYNPLSMLEDYFFAVSAEGRGSKVEVLPGGGQLGEIDDLKFFTNKLARGLRIPSSFLPTGPDDGTAVYNDGKVGTAYIQEFRFNKYCQRLQAIIQPTFDREFKLFMKARGYNVESSLFDITFVEPQSFSQYRQIEIDSERASLFNSIESTAYLSKRFMLEKYLGLTPAEIIENERMLKEERGGEAPTTDDSGEIGLGDVGIKNNDIGGEFDGDFDDDFDDDFGDDADASGDEGSGNDAGGNEPEPPAKN